MNVSKTVNAVDPKGGGELYIKEVLSDGSNTSPQSPVIDLGLIAESDFKDTTTQKELEDETGATFLTMNEKRTVTLDSTLWQSDTNMVNAIKEMRDKYFTVVYKKSAKLNQWIVIPVTQAKPDFNWKSGDGKIKLTFSASELNSNWSLSGTSFSGSLTAGFGISGTTATTATVSANDYYVSIS